ncbi:MBL fold metallo-hydrolase [Alicyclobacillus tolerans]|uniref:MBL fold metallo-hydrolase n=1 Tax=Alicyclobacillus tolerans TaxID=90970 RepID=UPI001F2C5C39|nr:MBL fold metallo-hydrolase [Alicyclobacillus tolerans]MCF8567961.1 MBL fold metallo-hydrolase [Alicyclobacillus tolerans]
MRISENIYASTIQLSPETPLHVYLVKGENFSVLIDSGVKSMFSELCQLFDEAGVVPQSLKYVLHTHSHHDHIGCNRQLKDLTGCMIVAHPFYADWHRNFQTHYREFALMFPDIIGDSAELRAEVFDPLDGEVPLDLTICEGTKIYPGGDTILEAFSFPGHMKAEFGYLEHSKRTLILGDAITGLNWGIFHSHLDVQGYRNSLKKIRQVIEGYQVERVLLSHFGVKTPEEAIQLTRDAEDYVDQIEYNLLRSFVEHSTTTLRQLWLDVCQRMNRKAEFRALNMVNAHVEDLLQREIIRKVDDKTYRLRGGDANHNS